MALETLKDVDKIGGFNVCRLDQAPPHAVGTDPDVPVYLNEDANYIGFSIQNGPIKENGVNGCQVDTLIETALVIIDGLNKKFPSDHNQAAIISLEEALMHLKARTKDRETRGVEGYNKA